MHEQTDHLAVLAGGRVTRVEEDDDQRRSRAARERSAPSWAPSAAGHRRGHERNHNGQVDEMKGLVDLEQNDFARPARSRGGFGQVGTPTSLLIRELFPTLERPAKATAGREAGAWSRRVMARRNTLCGSSNSSAPDFSMGREAQSPAEGADAIMAYPPARGNPERSADPAASGRLGAPITRNTSAIPRQRGDGRDHRGD
jgi:hypothetical protein